MASEKTNTKTERVFAFTAFLNDLGHSMITPIWPAFITSVLGAPVSFLGLVDGIGEAASAITKYPAGRLADKSKRKPFIWIGYLLPVLARVGYAFSTMAAWILPLHALDRLGKGLREPARDGMLTEITEKEKRGKAFGFLRGWDRLGAASGPLVVFALFGMLGYANLILLAAVPTLLGVLLILFFVKEPQREIAIKKEKFEFAKMSPNFKRLIFISGIFGLGWFSISFAILYSIQVLGYTVANVALAVFMYTLASSIFSFIGGNLSDKIGRKPVLALGMALYAVTNIGFILAGTVTIPFFVFILFVLNGMHYGILIPLQKAFVADMSSMKVGSSAQGLYHTVFGVTAMMASIIAGLAWDLINPTAIFYYGLMVSIIAMTLFLTVVKE